MKSKKIFITYGTKDFHLQKKHLINLAENSKFFDHCISYGPKDLSASFTNRHKNILKQKKGGGFWIWKYEGTPAERARGLAVGIFSGCFPFFGFHHVVNNFVTVKVLKMRMIPGCH